MHHKIAIRVDPEDNVLVALTDIKCSTEIEPGLITKELIPAKQKLAGRDFNDGNDITMYGVVVGSTKKTIRSGELISTENVAHKSSPYEGKNVETNWHSPDISKYSDHYNRHQHDLCPQRIYTYLDPLRKAVFFARFEPKNVNRNQHHL